MSALSAACLAIGLAGATELHVSPAGDDANSGAVSSKLRTISEAANRAQPGDTVTVHEGIYRERVNPPRGGTGENTRIVYQAAPGEKATIKGSEIVTGWQFVGNDTWTVTLPAGFFGSFNPFNNTLIGDWYTTNRTNHSSSVYLNGDWLLEGTSQATVLQPASGTPQWFATVNGGGSLFNVGSFQPFTGANAGTRVDASFFDRSSGVIIANNSEGSQCVGFIEDGDWTSHASVDFGTASDSIQFRAASATIGGRIEIHLDSASGPLAGTCTVANTSGWQNWQTFTAAITPTSGSHAVYLVYRYPAANTGSTTIWAQFPGKNPNTELVEVNARQSVFYPDQTGRNYITVRGFTLEQAATPFAPPTAEQIGIIGPHWSKGWIIEDNTVRYATCCGISLGKYGDRWDNTATSVNWEGAGEYADTITRALNNGWNKATVGSHVVRSNHVHHCEQTGIVGGMGCAFSTVTGNDVHDVHVRGLFSGAEMAGIKFHGAVDVELGRNYIHGVGSFGVWLDWMAQGTRVTGNVFRGNSSQDLFMEVNHGPFMVDHNVSLSAQSLYINSQGGTFAHNLFAGGMSVISQDNRLTPYHTAHSTAVVALHDNPNGDMRFYNNLFVQAGQTTSYNSPALPVWLNGNVYLNGAAASTQETTPLVLSSFNPALQFSSGFGGYYLRMNADPSWGSARTRQLVTTAMLGNASISGLPYEHADGTPYRFDTDLLGSPRNNSSPFPGPFEVVTQGENVWKVFDDPSVAGPTGLTATPGIGRVVLNWSTYFGATAYTVKRATTSGGPYTTVANNVTDTTWIDTNVTIGVPYFYVISASNGVVESANSAETSAAPATAMHINCGGSATGNFSTDAFYSTGSAYTSGTAVNTSGVANAAPAAIYQSERWGLLDYTVPGLAPGASYLVRLHFAEIYFNSAGSRVWNVLINGTTVLPNFDAFVAAGGANKAVVRDFTATADGGGRITISLSAVISNPKISGFEILPLTAPDAPGGLTASSGYREVILSWPVTTGASGYRVWRASAGAGPYSLIATTADTHFSDHDVSYGQTWYYRVSATNAYGESPDSDPVAITLTAPPISVWTNGSGGSWPVSGNWMNNGIASGVGVVADFSTLDLSADATVTLDGARTVGALVFGDVTPSHKWILNTGSSGPITLSAGYSPQIQVNNSSATINAVLAGTSELVKSGAGSLTLTGANTYSGATTVSGGTLVITPTASVATNSTLTQSSTSYAVANGATLRFDASNISSGAGGFVWDINPVSVDAGGTLELYTTTHSSISTAALLYWGNSDQISGAGTIKKDGAGVFDINGAGTLNSFTGSLNVTQGILALQGSSTSAVGNFAVDITSGATLDIRTDSHKIGTLTGSGNIAKSSNVNGTSLLTIGNDNRSGIFTGNISPVGGVISLTKAGSGTQVLGGALSYSGATMVNGGKLVIDGTSTNSAFTVTSGGTLGGIGSIGGPVTMNSGGTLNPGTSLIGTITLASPLTLNSGSICAIDIAGASSNDKIVSSGSITANGTIKVTLSGFAPLAGASFDIVDGTITGSPTFDFSAASLPVGLSWDTSQFASSGVIKVSGGAYSAWIGGYFPSETSPAVIGPDADPDRDGVTNGIEFLTGTVPNSGSSHASPLIVRNASGNLVVSFQRQDQAEACVVSVEWGSSLQAGSWTQIVVPNDAVSSPSITVIDNGTAPDDVTVTIPASADPRKFARVRIDVPAAP